MQGAAKERRVGATTIRATAEGWHESSLRGSRRRRRQRARQATEAVARNWLHLLSCSSLLLYSAGPLMVQQLHHAINHGMMRLCATAAAPGVRRRRARALGGIVRCRGRPATAVASHTKSLDSAPELAQAAQAGTRGRCSEKMHQFHVAARPLISHSSPSAQLKLRPLCRPLAPPVTHTATPNPPQLALHPLFAPPQTAWLVAARAAQV